MAAPPEDLRAHDRGSKAPCECQKFEKTGGKFFTGQIVGVTPKCRMSPSRVRGIPDGLAAASPAVDTFLLDFLDRHTFTKADVYELLDGQM
jgi:hypothetical protein